ncbi:uncharacterized protein LOC142525833 [Primulina tabacum]|uniref:uncharacterized protein LOC142525833 n=1 Tax=Primulina tabacum TaxID=48773 RepID=UPI003F5A2AAA
MRRLQSPDLLIFDPQIERTARRLRKAKREEILAMAENRENDRHMPPEAIPIRDHFRPVINAHYSGIARGTINANDFELKPALINMVQQNQFAGTATSDPHVHLRTFMEIIDTVKINNVHDDIIRLCLFPFSLRDQARGRLQSLPLGSITTWQELATKFFSKYFSPVKYAQLKIEISTFRQTDFEQLYEAWERYKELLRRCSNHGFEDWVQIELFYNGLNGQTQTTMDAATGGTIFSKSPAQAYDLLEQMTITMTTQIAIMNKVSTSNTEGPPLVVEEPNFLEEVQYINNKNFRGYEGYRAREEKKVDNTPVRDKKPTPTKRVRGKKYERYNSNQCIDISLLPYPQRFLQLQADFQKKQGFEDLKNLHTNNEFADQVEGASVNIMPSSLYEKLGLSKIKPIGLSLQMADKLIRTPLGIVEDVELRIDKLKVLAEFVVVDMENSQNVHVILGRPLLATVGAIIDVKRGKLTMDLEGQRVEIKASKSSHDPP